MRASNMSDFDWVKDGIKIIRESGDVHHAAQMQAQWGASVAASPAREDK